MKVVADEGWLHLALFLPGPVDFSQQAFLVGIDTVDPRRGDHRLPWVPDLRSDAGLEFTALFQGPGRTGVFVDAPYAVPEYRPMPQQRYRSLANEEGRFVLPTAKSNHPRMGRDGTRFPGHSTEIGWLRQGTQDRADPAFDSRAEWQVGRSPDGRGFIEARIPWGLLHVTDPSSRTVLDDPEAKPPGPLATAITPGFRFVLAVLAADKPLGEGKSSVRLTLPATSRGRIPLPPLFTWATWARPTFHRFRKRPIPSTRRPWPTPPTNRGCPDDPPRSARPAGTRADPGRRHPSEAGPGPALAEAAARGRGGLHPDAGALEGPPGRAPGTGRTLSWMKHFDEAIRDLKRHREVHPELAANPSPCWRG